MENYNAVSSTNSTNTNPPEVPFFSNENQSDSEESTSVTTSQKHIPKKGIPLYAVIIGLLVIMLLTSYIQLHQYRVYSDAVEQEAYLLSVSINLLEDNMFMQFGVFPEEVGLENLRSAWISNPCYETAMPYYEALSSFFEHFDEYTEPFYNLEPIQV